MNDEEDDYLGIEDNAATKFHNMQAQLVDARIFKSILIDQLVRNGHSEELRNMSELELLGYIVNALGGTVLQ